MASNIFLIDGDNKLSTLTQSHYDSEDLLQKLIANHPALLGSAIGADGGLLLVQREYGVPEMQDGAARWSLDHLFLDRDGVPVLVEVKRATDTRARREVVAQMLDYAANGIAYWPVQGIAEAFRRSAEADGASPDERLLEFLGTGDPEAYWKAVDANLRSGRIRMVFLADQIGKELRRIVEFLNEQMRPAEVLAVEVLQYVNPNGLRTLVPKLVGATERAQSSKAVLNDDSGPIDQDTWLDSLAEHKGGRAKTGAERAIAWMAQAGLEIGISRSRDSLSATLIMPTGKAIRPFYIRYGTGKLEVSLPQLSRTVHYASDESRLILLAQIKTALPMVQITTDKATGWPSVPLVDLLNDEVWRDVERLMREICCNLSEVRGPHPVR